MKQQSEFRVGPRRKLVSEINVVPYIDVMLVLLVVFMITAPMMTQGVKVDLPDANAEPITVREDESVILSVRRDGSYRINVGERHEDAVSLEDVVARVGATRRQKPETMVLVEGDQAVPYGRVVTLMAALQKAGVTDVGLVTEPAAQPVRAAVERR